MKEFKLSEKIREELEKGIERNDVLPLDYAMDRIKPILKEFIRRLKDMRDIDKYEGYSDCEKFINKIDKLTGDLK